MSLDPEHKFDLSLDLGKLSDARKILDDMPKEEYDTTDAQSKWKRLGDLALTKYVCIYICMIFYIRRFFFFFIPTIRYCLYPVSCNVNFAWKRLSHLALTCRSIHFCDGVFFLLLSYTYTI